MTSNGALSLSELQAAVGKWSRYNFPERHFHRPLLGLVEEVGELSHAHLKSEQGIRGTTEEHHDAKKDAIGDILIYLCDYCTNFDIDLEESVMETWAQVSQRDWQKYPKDGKTE